MRILIVNSHRHDHLGGSQIQCDLIARQMTGRGHHVLYFAVRMADVAYPTKIAADYPVYPATLTRRHLVEACTMFKPDIVFWRFNKKGLRRAVQVFRSLEVPIVFSVSHINDVSRWGFQAPRLSGLPPLRLLRVFGGALTQALYGRWNHAAFRHIDGLVSQNAAFLGKVRVPLQVHVPNSMVATAVEFEWPRPFCLWVGNIKKRKNPELFVQLADRLRDTGTDFLMVGPFHDRGFAWIARGSATSPNFHYLGSRTLTEVNGMLKEAQLLVHTCEPEGFPNNFIQAWLHGRPTVSLHYDPDRLIRSRQLGFVSGSMDALERDVRRLLGDEPLRAAMGARARRFARERFDPERNGARIERFLHDVLARAHTSVAPSPRPATEAAATVVGASRRG